MPGLSSGWSLDPSGNGRARQMVTALLLKSTGFGLQVYLPRFPYLHNYCIFVSL